MNATAQEKLTSLGCQVAMHAAVDYVRANGGKVDTGRLSDLLKVNMKAALFEALDDAMEATKCGMHQIAEATFTASMQLVGIKSAKEALA